MDLSCTAGFFVRLSDEEQGTKLLAALHSADEKIYAEALSYLRVAFTCSDAQKAFALKLDIPARLVDVLASCKFSDETINFTLYALLSLCYLGSQATEAILEHGRILDVLSILITREHSRVVETAFKLLRMLFSHSWQINEKLRAFTESERFQQIVAKSLTVSPAACQLLTEIMGSVYPSLVTTDNHLAASSFNFLLNQIDASTVIQLLSSDKITCKRAALASLIYVLSPNVQFRPALLETLRNDPSTLDNLIQDLTALSSPSESQDIQLLALDVFLELNSQKLVIGDQFILQTVVPGLLRLCRRKNPIAVRVGSCDIISRLGENRKFTSGIENNDQLLICLLDCLKYSPLDEACPKSNKRTSNSCRMQLSVSSVRQGKLVGAGAHLKRAAFMALSSLAGDCEMIRKRITELENGIAVTKAVECVVDVSNHPKQNVVAALRFLLSLSRSVYVLRTVFKDHNIWEAVLKVLISSKGDLELATVSSAIVANLSLEFSPGQQAMLRKGLLDHIMISSTNEEVVKNSVWTLMNLTYNGTPAVKKQLEGLLPIYLVEDLLKHKNKQIVTCTIGLIRNLLQGFDSRSPPPDIATRILRRLRGQLLNAGEEHEPEVNDLIYRRELVRIICQMDSNSDPEVFEGILCALVNVSSTVEGQRTLIQDDNALSLIRAGLQHSELTVNAAAVLCVTNLARPEEDGDPLDERPIATVGERHRKLLSLNIHKELRIVRNRGNRNLFERAKLALQYLNGSLM